MATAWVECWKCECESCGHKWIRAVGVAPPRLCAKCRSTKWNIKGAVAVGQDKAITPVDAAGIELAKSLVPVEVVSAKPDMQALRDIAAGKIDRGYIPATNEDRAIISDLMREVKIHNVSIEIPICGKTWWEDGEHFECLMDAGHREAAANKHGLRGMVRKLDD